LKGASLQPRRPREVEETLESALQARDLLLQHGQVAAAQLGGAGTVRTGRLHEQLHRHEGVAQLVSQSGCQLPQRRQLLAAAKLTLAALEALDHRADLLGDAAQGLAQFLEPRAGREGYRPDDLVELAGCVADWHAQPDDGAADCTGDAVAG